MLLHEPSAVADAAGMHPQLPLLPTACWQDRNSFRGQSDVYRSAGIELRDCQLTARLAATDILCNRCKRVGHTVMIKITGAKDLLSDSVCTVLTNSFCVCLRAIRCSKCSPVARSERVSSRVAVRECSECALTHMRRAQVKHEPVIRCMELSRSGQVLWQR